MGAAHVTRSNESAAEMELTPALGGRGIPELTGRRCFRPFRHEGAQGDNGMW